MSDAEDIARNASQDCNRNGVPDECEPLFPNDRVDLKVGIGPLALLAVDLDGDGRLDLATANSSNDVSVRMGNGDGTFKPEQRFAVGERPTVLVAADFDGDSHLDLATANYISNDVSVRMGNGDGSFKPEQRFAVGVNPAALVAADFTGDGRLDLATANGGSHDVSALIGIGDGTFNPEQRFAVGGFPSAIVAADFEGDGHMDLATTESSALLVLLGNGDGTFKPPSLEISFSVGFSFGPALVAADLSSDGLLDIATGGMSFQVVNPMGCGGPCGEAQFFFEVWVYFQNGDGTFNTEQRFDMGGFPSALVAVDLDSDGHLDIATANASEDTVSVRLGDGDGSFQDPQLFAVGDGPSALVAADLDGDGRLDLATANAYSHDVSIHFATGDLFFKPHQRGPVVGNAPRDLVAADIDDDSRPDLVSANSNSNDISVLLGKGDGTFKLEQRSAVGRSPWALVAVDLDGDGRLDIATANLSNDISVLLGKGDGTFKLEQRFAVGEFPRDLVATDLDGDGNLDLATANSRSSGVSMLFGNGDGTFKSEQRFAAGVSYRRLVAADFDLDGAIDVALLADFGVEVKYGNGDGTFGLDHQLFAAWDPDDLVAIDLNGDEAIDLAITGGDHFSELTVLLGLGGDFIPRSYFLSGGRRNESWALVPADLNGDGTLDFVMANARSNDVKVLLVNGHLEEAFDAVWTFKVRKSFAVMYGPSALAASDFDGDGRHDLVTANWGSDDVSVLLNQSPVDRTPPVLMCPDTLSFQCTGPEGAILDFRATAMDDCDPSPVVAYDPPPGSVFPVGTTLVTCTASDASGKHTQCTFEATVTCGGPQLPGDCNQDGRLDLSDAIWILGHLFLGTQPKLPCEGGTSSKPGPGDLALVDINGDGGIDLSDGVSILSFLFLGSKPPVLGKECVPIVGCPDMCQ